MVSAEEKIADALQILWESSQVDGGHHKAWVIDQVARTLLGDEYLSWVYRYEHEEVDDDGEPQYFWDKGIAP